MPGFSQKTFLADTGPGLGATPSFGGADMFSVSARLEVPAAAPAPAPADSEANPAATSSSSSSTKAYAVPAAAVTGRVVPANVVTPSAPLPSKPVVGILKKSSSYSKMPVTSLRQPGSASVAVVAAEATTSSSSSSSLSSSSTSSSAWRKVKSKYPAPVRRAPGKSYRGQLNQEKAPRKANPMSRRSTATSSNLIIRNAVSAPASGNMSRPPASLASLPKYVSKAHPQHADSAAARSRASAFQSSSYNHLGSRIDGRAKSRANGSSFNRANGSSFNRANSSTGGINSSRHGNQTDAAATFNNVEIRKMVEQVNELRRFGLNVKSEDGGGAPSSSSFIPYKKIVSNINATAERFAGSVSSATHEAGELCEQFQSFMAQAHDWTKETEAQHKNILDNEVKVAKIVAGMIAMYQPNALDVMHDILGKLQQMALDNPDDFNPENASSEDCSQEKHPSEGSGTNGDNTQGEEAGESSSCMISSSFTPESSSSSNVDDEKDDDVEMQDN